jgi:CDP-6-deoxy-D-xylo-4-hexulose-3-dehydrase
MNFIPVNTPKLHALEKKYVKECIKTNWFSSEGKFVKLFEKNFSSFNKRKFGVAVSNGTAALEIAVKSLNLKKNSEVLIPSFSIISTANAVIKNNLKPVLIDCDLDTWNINIKETIKKITKNTKAIIITHIYGLPVDLDKILKIAKIRNIKIIEDAAEVIGLEYKNKICGSFGDLSIFSFYANKHITTGEGGMICTNDATVYKQARMLRSHGMVRECSDEELKGSYKLDNPDLNPDFIFAYQAYNCRNTEIGGIMGRNQLKRLDTIVKKRTKNLEYFLKKIDPSIYRTEFKTKGSSNYAFNLILNKADDILVNKLMDKMRKGGIEFRRGSAGGGNQIRQPYLKGIVPINHHLEFPETEHVHFYGFYIGNFPDLRFDEIEEI